MADTLTFSDTFRAAVSSETRARKLDRALSWIHGNLAAHLDVVALAQLSNMNAPVMSHHFIASFGMTPIQYQRRLRMLEARRLLLMERLDIAAVRSLVGYHRPLAFVRDYRRRYRRTPMADAELGRAAVGCEGLRL